MASLDTLLTDILPSAPGASEPLILREVASAVRDFMARTEVLKMELDAQNIVADQAAYPLVQPASLTADSYKIQTVRDVQVDGYPCDPVSRDQLDTDWPDYRVRYAAMFLVHRSSSDGIEEPTWKTARSERSPIYFLTNPAEIRLVGIPSCAIEDGLTVNAVLTIRPGIQEAPDWLLDHYHDNLVDGAIGRLLAMPGQKWSDPALAKYHLGMFEAAITTAKGEAVRDFTRDSQSTGRTTSYA